MKQRQSVESAELAVQLPSKPSQASCASLLRALLKHLLYSRGQVPYLYDQFLQQALDEQQQLREEEEQRQQMAGPGRKRRRWRRQPKKSDRRCVQFLQKAESVMESVGPALFATDQSTRCLILLGSSTTKPREAYEVVMPAATPALAPAEAGSTAASRDDYACRLLLRQLVLSTADLPEGTAAQRPCKVFVLVQAPAEQAVPPGFLAKPNFKLAMRKGVHITFSLGAAAMQQQAQQQQKTALAGGACTEQQGTVIGEQAVAGLSAEAQQQQGTATWLQCRFVLRGLKSSSEMG